MEINSITQAADPKRSGYILKFTKTVSPPPSPFWRGQQKNFRR